LKSTYAKFEGRGKPYRSGLSEPWVLREDVWAEARESVDPAAESQQISSLPFPFAVSTATENQFE
jgi:hypothetical protein